MGRRVALFPYESQIERISKPALMAIDLLARKISMGFPGGSLTATRGLLQALFGEDLVQASQVGESNVSRLGHTRTRVIGGPSTGVASSSFVRKQYGAARANGGSGGEAVQMLYQGDWWTVRLSGSHQALNDWLGSSLWQSGNVVMWRSEKGTTYGPFTSATSL